MQPTTSRQPVTVWEYFETADGSVELTKLWYLPSDGFSERRFIGRVVDMSEQEAMNRVKGG